MNERMPCGEDLVEVGHGRWLAIWSVKVNGSCVMADGSEEDVLQRYEWNSFAGDEGGWVPKPVERHSPIDPACTDHHGYEERKKYGCTGPDPGQYVYSGELKGSCPCGQPGCESCDVHTLQVAAYRPVYEAPAEASPKELRDWLTTARAVARSYEEENARLRSELEQCDTERMQWFNEAHDSVEKIQRVRDALATSVVKTSDLYHVISEALGDDDDE